MHALPGVGVRVQQVLYRPVGLGIGLEQSGRVGEADVEGVKEKIQGVAARVVEQSEGQSVESVA